MNFSIGNNETVAIVGPNGAGETTLLEILMTLRSFTGNIEMMGEKMDEKHLSQIRSKIGVIFQEGGMYAYLKVKEILYLFANFYTNVDNQRILTYNLDSINEQGMKKAVDKLKGQKTVIVVAHRLSTIIDSDIIYVLEHGRVVGAGNHNELIDAVPLYRELAKEQFVDREM